MKMTQIEEFRKAIASGEITYTRETIHEGLRKDLLGVHFFVSEILSTPEAIDALVDSYWKRYQEMVVEGGGVTSNPE